MSTPFLTFEIDNITLDQNDGLYAIKSTTSNSSSKFVKVKVNQTGSRDARITLLPLDVIMKNLQKEDISLKNDIIPYLTSQAPFVVKRAIPIIDTYEPNRTVRLDSVYIPNNDAYEANRTVKLDAIYIPYNSDGTISENKLKLYSVALAFSYMYKSATLPCVGGQVLPLKEYSIVSNQSDNCKVALPSEYLADHMGLVVANRERGVGVEGNKMKVPYYDHNETVLRFINEIVYGQPNSTGDRIIKQSDVNAFGELLFEKVYSHLFKNGSSINVAVLGSSGNPFVQNLLTRFPPLSNNNLIDFVRRVSENDQNVIDLAHEKYVIARDRQLLNQRRKFIGKLIGFLLLIVISAYFVWKRLSKKRL